MAIVLVENYYQQNFRSLIDFVFSQYEDLLSDTECKFYSGYCQLSDDAQRLYVRMLMRKGLYFRLTKLQYNEIASSKSAAEELERLGLANIVTSPSNDIAVPLFNKSEWLSILKESGAASDLLKLCKSLKRDELDVVLRELSQLAISEPVIEVLASEHFNTYRLLFFGNMYQDLSEFVLQDLGLYRYADYRIDTESRLYESRTQIEAHLEYYELIDDFDERSYENAKELVYFANALPTPEVDDKVLQRRIEKLYLKIARQLERLDYCNGAMYWYRKCKRTPSRERQARILAKENKVEAALALCDEILGEPVNDEEQQFAQGFSYRLGKKHGIVREPLWKYTPHTEQLLLSKETYSKASVELNVVKHQNQSGDCYFVENAVFNTVFALVYWDVLFAPVRGAFTHPFQSRAHDLYESDFLVLRKKQFDQANANFDENTNLSEWLVAQLHLHAGVVTPFTYGAALDTGIIRQAFERIPKLHWRLIFQRLWSDLQSNRSGFPDLLFFPEGSGYELLEVKGPGDRLQLNQQRWMEYFAQHEIPHRVIHVQWQ